MKSSKRIIALLLAVLIVFSAAGALITSLMM